MPILDSFIIIRGKAKSLQIESISEGKKGLYWLKYDGNNTIYRYRRSDIVRIYDNEVVDHTKMKLSRNGMEVWNVAELRAYRQGTSTHWRVRYAWGTIEDFVEGELDVKESALISPHANDTWEYLKDVASHSKLKSENNDGVLLENQYNRIDFIDTDVAAACYLDAEKYKKEKHEAKELIFPFGCNSSQEKAVKEALENQLSVIQGPPGTGKTQTILNIIANLLMRGKTMMVVSNNNAATSNVREKLEKHEMGFVVAALGCLDNKNAFVENQPAIPSTLLQWHIDDATAHHLLEEQQQTLKKLQRIFDLQEKQAKAKLEQKELELEWEHFKGEKKIDESRLNVSPRVSAKFYMKMWIKLQAMWEKQEKGFLIRLKERMQLLWMRIRNKLWLRLKEPWVADNMERVITELQALYYISRLKEICTQLDKIARDLKELDYEGLSKKQSELSMKLLRNKLCKKYNACERKVFAIDDLWQNADEVVKEFPVVTSTTFSARMSLNNLTYDYLIMDEASQVPIETGILALTCARNAVIVGDVKQLPNVVTNEDMKELDEVFGKHKVDAGYNCGKLCFLESVCQVIPDIPQTLLREHYRCHPKIINFCNQKFYGGNLLIMTQDNDEKDVLMAIKTAEGNHRRGRLNQREIDVVKQEVLPLLNPGEEIGIVTPYNEQVNAMNAQLPIQEAGTVHKYQGREKDTIIMSVVDDEISEFSDDANLLNVAVSRAKKRFCLVMTGNKQEREGNITELLEYVKYQEGKVTDSKIHSIFDYLYTQYSEERMRLLSRNKRVSDYDSENLTYMLIKEIIKGEPGLSHLGVIAHMTLRNVINDTSLMSEKERTYASNRDTHLDFLIINHVTKKPVLAIETDGYAFHAEGTAQHERDLKKDHILEVYALPLIRLRTNGSGEKEIITTRLNELVS